MLKNMEEIKDAHEKSNSTLPLSEWINLNLMPVYSEECDYLGHIYRDSKALQ